MRRQLMLPLGLTLALSGCAAPYPAPPVDQQDPSSDGGAVDSGGEPYRPAARTTPLDPPALTRRLSLDLRGVSPTVEELAMVSADPNALDGLVSDWMAEPQYERRLVEMLGEVFLTRVDAFNISEVDYHLGPEEEFAFERSVGDEPLRLMAHVAARDVPWTEIVTADYTMANPMLLNIWPLEAETPPDGDEWVVARYTDGRPAGGVVMTNGLWWRYYTTPNNFNRARAAALSRLMLCDDYLTRPIRFEAPALLDADDMMEATRTQPACLGCHVSLDPLASALFGFWWFDIYDTAEMSSYHPEREWLGESYLGVTPGYFGQPMDGPADLGPYIAADPRFRTCAVRTMARVLWRRDADPVADFFELADIQADFEAGELRMSALVLSLLQAESYRAGALIDPDDDRASVLSTRRMLSVEQLTSVLKDLTGFVWTYGGFDMLANDEIGYRALGGGVDGHFVTRPARDPSLSDTLLRKRVAQAAAAAAMQREFVDETHTTLFGGRELDDIGAGTDAFDDVLDGLHLRLHGKVPTDEVRALETQLWLDVEAESGALIAWECVLGLMLRDPDFWLY